MSMLQVVPVLAYTQISNPHKGDAGVDILHHAKDSSRSQSARVRIRGNPTTRSDAADFKEVCAGVHGTDERRSCLVWRSITIAEERHHGGLCPSRTIRAGNAVIVRARGAIRIVEDQFATAEEGIGSLLAMGKPRLLVKIFGIPDHLAAIPYGIYLPLLLIICADILPAGRPDTNHIMHVLNHRRAYVNGKIGGVIVALGVPTLIPICLMDLLSIFHPRR